MRLVITTIIIITIIITIAITMTRTSYMAGKVSESQIEDYIDQSNIIPADNKPYLWVYWELKKGVTKPPPYITLCLKIIKQNSYLFNYILLDDKTIYNYLPDLREDINQLPLALKTDYIRVALLYKYGGLWLDADTIMMTDLYPIINLLNNKIDFIGFSCTGAICVDGYGKPSNSVMASQKNSLLMKVCLNVLDMTLDNYFSKKIELKYHTLGKYVIWDNIKYLEMTINYKYYHYPIGGVGTRDINGRWITKEIIFPSNIQLLDEHKLILVLLANNIYCGHNKKYNWFCKLSENEILTGNYYISRLFIRALNYKKLNI